MVSTLSPTPKPPVKKRGRNVITGVMLAGQLPALEQAGKEWRVWISYNDDYSTGTYLVLHSSGKIDRRTVVNKKITNTACIKEGG